MLCGIVRLAPGGNRHVLFQFARVLGTSLYSDRGRDRNLQTLEFDLAFLDAVFASAGRWHYPDSHLGDHRRLRYPSNIRVARLRRRVRAIAPPLSRALAK
jgi:hypothetical protein